MNNKQETIDLFRSHESRYEAIHHIIQCLEKLPSISVVITENNKFLVNRATRLVIAQSIVYKQQSKIVVSIVFEILINEIMYSIPETKSRVQRPADVHRLSRSISVGHRAVVGFLSANKEGGNFAVAVPTGNEERKAVLFIKCTWPNGKSVKEMVLFNPIHGEKIELVDDLMRAVSSLGRRRSTSYCDSSLNTSGDCDALCWWQIMLFLRSEDYDTFNLQFLIPLNTKIKRYCCSCEKCHLRKNRPSKHLSCCCVKKFDLRHMVLTEKIEPWKIFSDYHC